MSAFCALLIVLLAACAGGSSSSSSSTTTGSLSGGTDISGKTILFEIKSGPSNSFFVPVVNGAKAAAALTGLKLQIQYGNDDDATIVSQMNTAIASNVVGIAVTVPDAGLNKVVCDARAKNIAVVAFNTNGATGQGATCVQSFVGQDFVLSGALIAQRMINDGKIKPGDHVFCPVESPDQVYAVQRYQGVKQALDSIGAKCEVLGTGNDLAPAQSTLVSYLLGHPHTAAIIALGGTPLSVAPAAIKKANLNIPIGGFDLSPDILKAIKSGVINATVDQQPYTQGFQAVIELALYLKYGITPANINTSNRALIDSTNVDQVVPLVGGANAIRGG
ncbi:MAG TPA: substrate-binding domain-containing protein [Ktedonobacteraceae bacterium]|nr:substrate-binding domain-containing protein [Ktedonobacteraceae bacterium]